MFRALYLHTLVNRLLAIEAAVENPMLQQFTIRDNAEPVLLDGWNVVGELYYNLVSEQIASSYPLTNQVILSRTGDKDSFELKTATILAEDYLQFNGLVNMLENLIEDCWLLIGLELAGEENVEDPDPGVFRAVYGDKSKSNFVRITMGDENASTATMQRGHVVTMVLPNGQVELIDAFEVDVGMSLRIAGTSEADAVIAEVASLHYFFEKQLPVSDAPAVVVDEYKPSSLD